MPSGLSHTVHDYGLNQKYLERTIRKLFPQENIFINVKKDTNLINPHTGRLLEVDIWVPKFQLSFEYQDPHHYVSTWYNQHSLAKIHQKDSAKMFALLQRGETLLTIPCWWDGTAASLIATILKKRPDVPIRQMKGASPIPLVPPEDFFKYGNIPDVGELMLASFPINQQFSTTVSIHNSWWVGEKYDGIRACWNPKRKIMYSRYGMLLNYSNRFKTSMPRVFVDGELWFGKGFFVESQRLVKGQPEDVVWYQLRFVCFDVPNPLLNKQTFETRYCYLLTNVPLDHLFLIVVARLWCEDQVRLKTLIQQVIEDGGEGVILRKPSSLYLPGRGDSLIKLKGVRGDKEALVVERLADNSLVLQLPDSRLFTVPAESVEASIITKSGDIVSFTYDDFTRKSLPTNPLVYRIRTDVTWENILATEEEIAPTRESQQSEFSAQPIRRWGDRKSKSARKVLEKVVRRRGLDPLLPDTWYEMDASSLLFHKATRWIFKNNKGGFAKVINTLFPDIGLDESYFKFVSLAYWKSVANRRRFFVEIAEEKGFDPLLVANWYSLTLEEVLENKSATLVLAHYNGSFETALAHLFPEVPLERNEFAEVQRWQDISNRRNFLLDVAKAERFDPLVAANWYEVNVPAIVKYKDARSLLSYYSGNLVTALMHLFPQIGLDRDTFVKVNYWKNVRNQRSFFLQVAQAEGFDPLVPDNWYTYSVDTLTSHKGSATVLGYYDGKLENALVQLFPEIGLDLSKFSKKTTNYWSSLHNRRTFFRDLALSEGFDPQVPNNWYLLTLETIARYKGSSSLLAYYKGSFVKALIALFPEMALDKTKFLSNPSNRWSRASFRRKVLSDFAESKGQNPLSPYTWYNIVEQGEFSNDVKLVLESYNGSFVTALLDLFSDIGLERSKFGKPKRDPRRAVLMQFAHDRGFDPLIAANWYSVDENNAISQKEIKTIVNSGFNGNFAGALCHLFPDIGLELHKFQTPPKSYWLHASNRRRLLEDFAREQGFDALMPDNWYNITSEQVLRKKGADKMLEFYNGSLERALVHLFPEIRLDETSFSNLRRKLKLATLARRQVFETYAARAGFDPLFPENWYSMNKEKALAFKEISEILPEYGGNVSKALTQLFPDIGLDVSRFAHVPRNWMRQRLVSYAHSQGFDPLVPENWYNVPRSVFMSIEGVRSITQSYQGSQVKALVGVFPELKWDESKFIALPRNYWLEESNRRKLFLDYAEVHHFDPYDPANWYTVSRAQILETKGGAAVVGYYGGSFVQALRQLFPTISFDAGKFGTKPKNYWHEPRNRRKFFEKFASLRKFDPLIATNWYSLVATIQQQKGCRAVVEFHKNSIPWALIDLFPEVEFNIQKFGDIPRHFWTEAKNRRNFFEHFAKKRNFDALVPDFWYKIKMADFRALKGIDSLVAHHQNSAKRALLDLFPDISFDESKFLHLV